MNKWKIRNSEGEFDLRGTKATLLIMLGVPVIVSLALVATAVIFGKPLDSAQVLTDNPGITSVSWFGYGTHGLTVPDPTPVLPNRSGLLRSIHLTMRAMVSPNSSPLLRGRWSWACWGAIPPGEGDNWWDSSAGGEGCVLPKGQYDHHRFPGITPPTAFPERPPRDRRAALLCPLRSLSYGPGRGLQ